MKSCCNTDNRTTEGNIAGFLTYRADIAKIHINGGARLEHVSFRYYDHGIYMPTQSRSYNNLFPDLSVSFPIKNVRADLSYTAKTRRPTYTMLSNNLQYNDRYTYQGGNPLLQPSIIHTIGLNLSYRWINFSANWNQYHNLFYQYIEPYKNNSDITVFTFKNLSHSQVLYTGCTLTPKVGLWQPMVDVGIQKQFFHVMENGSLRKYDHPIAFFTFNNAFQLPKDFIINVDMDYTTSGNSTAIKWERSGGANVGIYKGILKDRLTFNIQINDIFSSYRNSNRLHYGNRDIYKWNRSDSRQLWLTVRYKFNSAKSKYKGTGAGNEEKSRL